MSSSTQIISMMTAMAVVNVGGTACLRQSIDPNKQLYFVVGLIAYIVGATLYVALLKESSLAVMAVASSTLQMGLVISLSVWLFDERINFVQGTAMLIAVASAAVAMLAASN